MIKLLTITLILLTLTSCMSPVASSWSCKNNLKGGCRTIAEIDNNKNNYRKHKTNSTSKNDFKTSQSIIQSNLSKKTYEDIRTAESVSKVVFAPYIDKAGNRHDFSTVYYVERKSDWRN